MLAEDKVTELFCIPDDCCKYFDALICNLYNRIQVRSIFGVTELTFKGFELTFCDSEATFKALDASVKVSFPDFSRRFFASLAGKIYTFSLGILLRFTVSLIPCCEC